MGNNKAKIIMLILMFVVLVLQLTCVIPSLIGCMIVLGLKGIIDLFLQEAPSKMDAAFYCGVTLVLLVVLEIQL